MGVWKLTAGAAAGLLVAITVGSGAGVGYASDPAPVGGDEIVPLTHTTVDPRYQSVNSTTPGPDGAWSRIKAVNQTIDTSLTRHVAAFVRVSVQADHGTKYMHAGWIKGGCGGTNYTSPTVFVAYQKAGSGGEICTAYTGHSLSSGTRYDFRIINSSTETWKAQFKSLGATSWNDLETRTLDFGPATNFPATAVEYTSAATSTRASLTGGGIINFTEAKKRTSGIWSTWGIAGSGAGQEPQLTDIGLVMALGNKYNRWYASVLDPAIALSASPASLTLGFGQEKTSAISVTTNPAYAPYIAVNDPNNFLDPMTLGASSSSSSVIASISNPDWAEDPRAVTTYPATLTVTSLSTTSGTVNVTVTATSESGVTKSLVVPVTVTFP